MADYSVFISKKWNIAREISSKICEYFEKGYSVYYCNDYVPEICVEVDISVLTEIFATLKNINALLPKKKRIINSLQKSGLLNSAIEKRVNQSTDSIELDDISLTCRLNTKSKAQKAIEKGLGVFAELFEKQEIEEGNIEELAEEYIGKDSSLKTTADVLNGVKDILIERYTSDETVRSMVREIGFEDGFFEVITKNKKDKQFSAYRGKLIPANELTSEEFLELFDADEKKIIRFKHGIQLFHINEILRHHFIENPDFIGFDFLCEVLDECWSKELQQMVEDYVKNRLYENAEEWALRKINEDIQKRFKEKNETLPLMIVAQFNENTLIVVAVTTKGSLLGATTDDVATSKSKSFSNRLRQFYQRYKPVKIIVIDNNYLSEIESITNKTLNSLNVKTPLEKLVLSDTAIEVAASKWMSDNYNLLEEDMKKLFAAILLYLQPLHLATAIGVKYFDLHALQRFIKSDKLEQLLLQRIILAELHEGIPVQDTPDSVLKYIDGVPGEVLINIRKDASKNIITSKNSLLSVEGMTESIFRNIAGYCIIPKAKDTLDRTMVHPDHFDVVNEISSEIKASIDSLVNNPELVREYCTDDYRVKAFIEQKLIEQLRCGQKYQLTTTDKKFLRKLRLSELQEGAVISGRVTNITKFGVFVDINAICDGLIHISQLADGYIESPEQVVKLNDIIDAKILAVDKKKRRVSLSMKRSGTPQPRVRPSKGQLNNLADFFKNR